MPARLYKATANFPSLGDESSQEVLVSAGSWSAAMGQASRKLKVLPALRRRQIKSCSILLQLVEGGADAKTADPAPAVPGNGHPAEEAGDE